MNDPKPEIENTPVSEQPKSPAKDDGPARVKCNALTAEEQMALYEKELKEDDWGHQPC